jgi:diguanylate cyclase (GGDEF)-like protein
MTSSIILRVVILEDNDSDYSRLVKSLAITGREVTITRISDASELIEGLDNPPDLIIADRTMPPFETEGGIQSMRDQGVATPIVVVANSLDAMAAFQWIRAGAADYLIKGRLARLGPSVERAFAERELRIAKDEVEARLSYVTNYDEVTGLLKRSLLQDRLVRMFPILKPEERLAVHFLDIDAFKDVNDMMGHAAGNEVLKQVARRLEAAVGREESISRLSGGKFAVLQRRASMGEIVALAERLVESFRPPLEVNDRTIFITASSGVSVYPEDGRDVESLFRTADIAMYAAKDRGRNRFQFFRPEFSELARIRVDLTHELRQVIADKEIAVAFQPVVRASDGVVVGVEALARMTSPTRGAVGPSEFIPIAESSGMVVDIGRQVREISFMWLRRWLDAGHNITVSLNVSTAAFWRSGVTEALNAQAGRFGIPAANVTLEITESALISDMPRALALLGSVRDEGYGVAVDDFGTGYSMLTSIRQMPLTSIKIDKEFIDDIVSDERSRVIVKMAIDLGHGLGLTVVAEGVETSEQRDILLTLGVDEIQGYFFARPMPGEEVAAFITAQRDRAAALTTIA